MKRILIIILTLIIFTGCKSVDNITVKHDTVYKTKTEYKIKTEYEKVVDSFYQKQDTFYSIHYNAITVHDTIELIDTCYLTNTEIQERVVYKNKPLKDSLGIIILIIIAVTIFYIALKEFLSKNLKL